MSGIGGIIQHGKALTLELGKMLTALSLPGERKPEMLSKPGMGMALAQLWPHQQMVSRDDITIAVDADLLNIEALAGMTDPPAGAGRVAECMASLYRAKGLDCVKLLEGNFSFALWDEMERRLVIAVDPFAAKNLYWALEGDRFMFASRATAVKAVHPGDCALNEDALMQFLILSTVPAPLSIYRNIHRLEPGHILIYEHGRVTQRRYWDLDYTENHRGSEEQWAQTVRQEIQAAVHRAMPSSPAASGAYLSGGTDSSSVVAFMSEAAAPVNTFSIAFSESKYSEVDFAHTTARRFKTSHHDKIITAKDALDAIPKIVSYYDEPFANSSAVGSYYCALMARESGVDVLLAGDGGDELFAGNERYASDKQFQIYHSIPRWLRQGVVEPLVNLVPDSAGPLSLPSRYVRRANIPNPRRVISYGLFLSTPAQQVFEDDFLQQAPPEGWMRIAERHHLAGAERSELNRMMYTDVKITLGDNDLRKVSGTAEMAGVAVRYPLLDRRLAEFSATIPSSLKMKGFKKRYIFKKAMEGILPEKVLTKTKHGFGVPLSLWLLQNPQLRELTYDTLSDARTRKRGYFKPEFISHLLEMHRTGHTAYYGEVVWYLLVLELWHRQHFESVREFAYA